MKGAAIARYEPVDRLFLWLLTDPAQPALVGDLSLVRTQRGVSLRYADAWIERGFALSEDLPLVPGEFMPIEKDTAAGAVDDARPDRWGKRVIRFIDKPPRLSLLEFLYFAGDDRFGALGVSTSQARYEPRRTGLLPTLADAAEVHERLRNWRTRRLRLRKGASSRPAQRWAVRGPRPCSKSTARRGWSRILAPKQLDLSPNW